MNFIVTRDSTLTLKYFSVTNQIRMIYFTHSSLEEKVNHLFLSLNPSINRKTNAHFQSKLVELLFCSLITKL